MTESVLSLTDSSAQNPTVAGTKGANLARMVAAGISVPQGFVVTTEVFANAISKQRSSIISTISGIQPSELDELTRASDTARDFVLESGLPDSVVSAIKSAYQELGLGAVSVRSSATDEDLSKASFAGQYDTFLNVLSVESLIERLIHVWASLYSPQALAYRIRNGIAHDDVRMAVVVQRQLNPEVAGVLFTRNPLTGENQIVVNAALGLGEGVVAGSTAADHFVLESDTGKVIKSDIVTKGSKIAAVLEGGVKRMPVPEELQDSPTLDETQLAALAALGQKISSLFGGSQDVEFAIEEGIVQCLQARPITGIVDVPTEPHADWEGSIDTNYGWLLSPMGMLRGPLYRLQQDAVESYVDGQRICFEETGSERSRNCIVQVVNGYAYMRSPDINKETIAERQARHNARCDAYIQQGTSYYVQEIEPKVEEILVGLERLRKDGDKAALSGRVTYLEEAIKALGFVMGHLHWCMTNMSSRFDWPSVYHEITDEPPGNSAVFVQAIPNMTTRLILRLRKLAKIVRDDPELSTIFAQGQYDKLKEPAFGQLPSVKTFKVQFNSLLRTYGFRTGWGFGSDTNFKTTTWGIEPAKPLALIASYAAQDLDELDRLDEESLQERQRKTRQVQSLLARDQESLQRFELNRVRAWGDVTMMENHNHLMEQCTVGQMRSAIFEMGKALVKAGFLDDPDDVLHLSLNELKAIAADNSSQDLRPLVSQRVEELQRRAGLQPPPTLGSGSMPPDSFAARYAVPEDSGLQGQVIRGVAASRGRVTGPVRLVIPDEKAPKIQRGDILVAQNVGPNWTPVFPILGALVLDQGALFQHAALVAREYRIPAVILAKDATSSITDGQVVTVDGDEGIVLLS